MTFLALGFGVWAVAATLGFIAARQDLDVARRDIETMRAQRHAARRGQGD